MKVATLYNYQNKTNCSCSVVNSPSFHISNKIRQPLIKSIYKLKQNQIKIKFKTEHQKKLTQKQSEYREKDSGRTNEESKERENKSSNLRNIKGMKISNRNSKSNDIKSHMENFVHSRRQYVKKLNGYLLTKKVKHKYLVKIRSF